MADMPSMETVHEEFGRQQLDDQHFEPPSGDEFDGDPYQGRPWGEQQEQVNWLESRNDSDPSEYSDDGFDDPECY